MEYVIRPLGPWLEPVTKPRTTAPFRVGWDDTLKLLGRELEQLGARTCVLQVDVTDSQLRRDGMLRSGSSVGSFPGVRVSFQSRHGHLTYATDEFVHGYNRNLADWQCNVRAVALALEALRLVGRYGVSGHGQQYRGWTAITATASVLSVDQAAELIAHWAADPARFTAAIVLADRGLCDRAAKIALAKTHPDRFGDPDTFARLGEARTVLAKYHTGVTAPA